MATFYMTLVLFLLITFFMALGVMVSGRRLKGSCGGVGGECPCADAGTPGACKIEDDDEDFLYETQSQSDGVVIYTPSGK